MFYVWRLRVFVSLCVTVMAVHLQALSLMVPYSLTVLQKEMERFWWR